MWLYIAHRNGKKRHSVNSKFMVNTIIACGVPIVSRGAGDTTQVIKKLHSRAFKWSN